MAERLERGSGQLRQGRGIEAGPDREAPVGGAAHQAVHLQRPGQSMGGGARETGGVDQLGQRPGRVLDRPEHRHRLVEHADPAYTVHVTRLESHYMRRKQR